MLSFTEVYLHVKRVENSVAGSTSTPEYKYSDLPIKCNKQFSQLIHPAIPVADTYAKTTSATTLFFSKLVSGIHIIRNPYADNSEWHPLPSHRSLLHQSSHSLLQMLVSRSLTRVLLHMPMYLPKLWPSQVPSGRTFCFLHGGISPHIFR